MTAPTIASEWEHFRGVDVAPNAPTEQLSEMRKAFYAGCASGLKLGIVRSTAEVLGEMHEYIAAEDLRRRRAMICTSCGATIMFLRTEKGGAMPIDAPFPNSSAVRFDPKIHTSHFATCPNAAEHRRKRK